jgi:hypothetical protein
MSSKNVVWLGKNLRQHHLKKNYCDDNIILMMKLKNNQLKK